MLDRIGPNSKPPENGPDVSEWYNEYHLRLLSFVRTNLRSESDAQDVSQEVYLRLLRVPEDRVIDHPRAYLFRVAANVVNDWRAGQRLLETRSPDALDEIPAPHDSSEDYDRQRQSEQVRKAIESLPALYRTTLLLKAQHDLTYREIADKLDVSERMVKRYIVKAYARLREELSVFAETVDRKHEQ